MSWRQKGRGAVYIPTHALKVRNGHSRTLPKNNAKSSKLDIYKGRCSLKCLAWFIFPQNIRDALRANFTPLKDLPSNLTQAFPPNFARNAHFAWQTLAKFANAGLLGLV